MKTKRIHFLLDLLLLVGFMTACLTSLLLKEIQELKLHLIVEVRRACAAVWL